VAFAYDAGSATVWDNYHCRAKLRARATLIPVVLMKSIFRRLWEGWKRVARAIGNFQARVLLTVFYAVLVLPLGLAVRLFADPLRIRRPSGTWVDRDSDATDMPAARRQW
jgi:hypothetical protein